MVEEDGHVTSLPGNGTVPNKGSQRNKNKNNNNNRTPGLSKENSSTHINTSEVTNNATVVNSNSKTNLNSKKGNKKSASNQQLTATVKPQVEEQPKQLNQAQPKPVETVKKTATKTSKTPTTATPIPVMVAPQQQQPKQKVIVKQQAKVKPTEKPPRLSLSKSYSESEDRAEHGSVASTPGPTTAPSGGSIFGPSSSVTTPAPLAPLSETLKQKTKVTPVGKILPEIKKPENLGAQFGPIGAKPPTMISSSGRKPTWCDSQSDPRSNNNNNNGMSNNNNNNRMDQPMFRNSPADSSPSDIEFSLRYQQQQQQQQQAFHAQQQQRLLNIDDITGGLGISSGLIESGSRLRRVGSAANTSPTHSSLMQTLQYERRQRTEEFFSQHQPEWPGFGTQLPAENYLETLWDNPPTDQQADAHVAGNRGSAVTSGWGNFSSIWPSTLWGTSVGLGPTSPPPAIEPLPTYNSRMSSAVPLQEANPNEYNNLASVWGETPSRQSPSQQQQQQQLQQGLNPSWSSTLFSNQHPHEE